MKTIYEVTNGEIFEYELAEIQDQKYQYRVKLQNGHFGALPKDMSFTDKDSAIIEAKKQLASMIERKTAYIEVYKKQIELCEEMLAAFN